MFKKYLALPFLLLLALAVSGQSLKPIAQMVAQAKQPGQNFQPVSFFAKQTGQLNQNADATTALQAGTLLYWDDSKLQDLRAAAGSPVSLTLPWEGSSSITLDLVPAKNFSPDFRVHAASEGGPDAAINTGIHYWGTVNGDPESLVAISVFDNELVGMVSAKGIRYTIGALANDRDRTHILYRDNDLKGRPAFNCFTDDDLHRIGKPGEVVDSRSTGPDNCVRMYVEADYTVFQNKGSVANATAYITGAFSQISILYANESVNVVLHDLKIWNVADPYTGPSASNYLNQFRTAMNGNFNGDLAHLVGFHGLGGVAYVDVLCFPSYGVGYSSMNSTYSNVPTYSWTVEVTTHEIGHNLGSEHTHACAWNGNNTAIDGCGPAAGYSEGCNGPLPTSGTIMSYCHLVSGVGIDFNLGFGPQPGNLIRSKVYNAACLNACGGGGGCTYAAINSNNFESGFGIWTDGGTDCIRTNNATYANSPTYSIQLRDNTNTSVMSTTNQNWTNYDEVTVDFSYITVSFENGEDFWVQKSTNGGSTYTTIGDFNAGTQFTNGVRSSGNVVIPGPFTSTTRLRFRSDASADDDQVYIDDVVITGCLQNFNGQPIDRTGEGSTAEGLEVPGITDLQTGPNPASDVYRIRFTAEAALDAQLTITDLAGRVVLQSRLQAVEGPNQFNTPVSALANGLYVVTLRAGDEVFTEKMVLSRQ